MILNLDIRTNLGQVKVENFHLQLKVRKGTKIRNRYNQAPHLTNKTVDNFNFDRNKDLSTLKSDIHLFQVDESLCLSKLKSIII